MNLRPYISLTRFDKPIGIWLLVLPALWAVGLAAPLVQIVPLMAIMLVGAAATRAAGCIMNDLTDRNLDARVERTRHRPLAAGTVPLWHAYALLALLLLVALLLALQLPPRVFWLALIAVPMIAAYPWMKRLTWWPQLFLGFTFNLSALFGWLATGAPLAPAALTLYAACMFWTLGYDTIYAVQDMADDEKVGIKSTARRFAPHLRHFIALCYGTMLLLLVATGLLLHLGAIYYVGMLAAAAHACWQWRQMPPLPARAGAIFRSNQWLGLLVLIGILLNSLI